MRGRSHNPWILRATSFGPCLQILNRHGDDDPCPSRTRFTIIFTDYGRSAQARLVRLRTQAFCAVALYGPCRRIFHSRLGYGKLQGLLHARIIWLARNTQNVPARYRGLMLPERCDIIGRLSELQAARKLHCDREAHGIERLRTDIYSQPESG